MYLKVEVLTLKDDLTETPSLGDMDDFKKNSKKNLILNFCFSFLFYRRLPAYVGKI